MGVPHLVTPQRIRLSRQGELVPQLGHCAPIVALCFSPRGDAVAALDRAPTVQVWSTDPADVLLIAPMPAPGEAVMWSGDLELAVRAAADEGEPVWWVRDVAGGARWRPSEEPSGGRDRARAYARRLARGWAVQHVDGPLVALERVPADAEVVVDPLGRFAATFSGAAVLVLDAHSGDLIATLPHHEAAISGISVSKNGDWVLSCDVAGRVFRVDPLRPDRLQELAGVRTAATCIAVCPRDRLVAVGDAEGQLSLLDLELGRRVLRTPRRVPSFEFELALVENIGYVGVRPESFTSFLASTHLILPVRPLPGRATAVAPGGSFPEMVVALADRRVVRIDLGNERVTDVARAPFPLRRVAASQYGAVGLGEPGLWWFEGVDTRVSPLSEDPVLAVAVDNDCELAAVARPDRVDVLSADGGGRSVPVADVRCLVFAEHKGKTALAMVDGPGVLWRWDPQRGRVSRVGVLDFDNAGVQLAAVRSLAADRDGTLRALVDGDNGHLHVAMVNLATGTVTSMLGLLVVGHQIVAAYDDDGTWLQPGFERSLRMVRALRAYEMQDWLRPTEPGST